jgi:hypothetical protein
VTDLFQAVTGATGRVELIAFLRLAATSSRSTALQRFSISDSPLPMTPTTGMMAFLPTISIWRGLPNIISSISFTLAALSSGVIAMLATESR